MKLPTIKRIDMKRVKTKHRDSGKKKIIRTATDQAVNYMLMLCYAAMKDELDLDVEQCRAWKTRLDRYAGYLANGTLSFEDIKKDLRKIGLEV